MTSIYDPPKSQLEISNLEQRDEIKQIVNLNSWDVLKTNIYTSLRNKFTWALCIFTVGIWHLVGFIGLWAMGFPILETIQHSDSFLGWTIGVFIIATLLGTATLLLNPKWRKGRLGEHTITITDSHLVEETEFNKTQISWDSVGKLSKGNSTFYVTHSGTEVFPISHRCFASKKEWDDFYNAMIEKHEKNKNA